MSNVVLNLEHVQRSYPQADGALEVLRDVNLTINAGEMVAMVGPSGSGKSTLLHAVGLLENPTAGSISIAGQAVGGMNDTARTALRRQYIGFVYQFHHLLPEFSALENIVLPQMIAKVSRRDAEFRARELLGLVGLSHRVDHRPGQLSGGEQQRVAIARALANKPQLLVADEPTGNLDPHTADDVFKLLRTLTQSQGLAALVATHNFDLARRMDRIVTLRDGMLEAAA